MFAKLLWFDVWFYNVYNDIAYSSQSVIVYSSESVVAVFYIEWPHVEWVSPSTTVSSFVP